MSSPRSEDDDLQVEVVDGIATVTFDRPAARNALTFGMYDALAALCEDVIHGRLSVAAMILTGAGDKAFAAGTDISRFRELEGEADALAYERRMDRVLGTLERVPVPTIAAIRGACTGGGAAIAAGCDLRLASPDIAFGFPIARTLGNCLSIGNLARLVALLGEARTREIILTGRLIRAEEAQAIGLVTELAEDPLSRAGELAATMRGHAPLTMAATKEGLRRLRERAAELDGDDLIVRCYTSADFREGMEAFLSKRKPVFRGE